VVLAGLAALGFAAAAIAGCIRASATNGREGLKAAFLQAAPRVAGPLQAGARFQ
jgi:hypothetical protein